MAPSLHVKKKSAWKKVNIPKDIFAEDDFEGLLEIQELKDYEILNYKPKHDDTDDDDYDFEDVKKIKKNRKRKQPDDADTKDDKQVKKSNKRKLAPTEASETSEPLAKKKKKAPEKKNFLQSMDTASSSINDVQGTITDSPKQPSRGKIVKNVNVDIVSEAVTGGADGLTIVCPNNAKKSKKKKKKKTKNQERTGQEELNSQKNDSKELPDVKQEEEKEKPLIDMSAWKNLLVPDVLLKALQEQGFDAPTEIQSIALPSAIRDRKDILGAAETGSGKTLAFGIPVLTKILNEPKPVVESDSDSDEVLEDTGINDASKKKKRKWKRSPPMALILEPTRELAVQVKNHLSLLAKYTDIWFATVVGGMSVEKQRRILNRCPQVIIATPGRLWQLIEEGNKHLKQLDHIKCLVVDEADRMVEKGHYEELTKILEMVNNSPRRVKNRQTFVMSATLTMEISLPKRLANKKKPQKKDEDKLKSLTERICVGLKPKVIDLTPKDKVAQTLTELRINCKADEKDFYLYYFLCQHPGRTLVFANSKDCLRRLVSLLNLLKCSPLPLHADMHQRQRLKNLDKFTGNSQSLLIASDVAARGLDIPKVDHVIHYQVPRTMENYIHRSGRTARASNKGLSVMLVGPEEARDYRKIIHGVKNGEELPLMPVEEDLLPAVKQRVRLAREIDVKEYRMKKKRLRNNFFQKAAKEMDMIVDDDRLLEDVGDSAQQAEDKQHLRQMKSQLESCLQCSLAPLKMSKYPTKSGQLVIKKSINLF